VYKSTTGVEVACRSTTEEATFVSL
jgi:hypothetical protein